MPGGGVSHKGGTETVVGELCDIAFDVDLGFGVCCHWTKLRRLVQEVVSRRAVGAARRGEDEAAHARFFRQFGQLHGCMMVDVVGQACVQVA